LLTACLRRVQYALAAYAAECAGRGETCDPCAAGGAAVVSFKPRRARHSRMLLLSGPAPGAHAGSASASAAAAVKSVE